MSKEKKQDVAEATAPELPETPATAVEPTILPVEIIDINTIEYVVDNHRKAMNAGKLAELVENIRANGVKQPIKVCRRGKKHVMIFGHRRTKASTEAGLTTIPAMIAEKMTDQQIAEEQVIENIHREDLSPIDEAHCVKTLMDGGHTLDVAASKLGKGIQWARQRLDLLRLDKKILAFVASGRLPIGHAILISRVGDLNDQRDLARSALGVGYGQSFPDAEKTDYVCPLRNIRKEITYKLCKMGSARWPKDAPYAGKRACNGCPDNTNTEPTLFAEAGIQTTSKKGNCTNPACFKCKAQAWEKDPVKIARDKERAAKMGGKKKAVAEAGEKRGESWEAQQKRVAALRKKFPWEPEQKFAVAMWVYAENVIAAIAKQLKKNAPATAQGLVSLIVVARNRRYFSQREERLLPSLKDMLGGGKFSNECLAMLWCKYVEFSDYQRPGINGGGSVRNVPIEKSIMADIAFLEDIAKAWKVEIGDRPKLEDFQPVPVSAEDLPGLDDEKLSKMKKAELVTLCKKYRLDDSGKRDELQARIQEHKSASTRSDDAVTEEADEDLAKLVCEAKRPQAEKAIAKADLATLEKAQGVGLKGDWRRAGVAKRIKALQKEGK